MQLTDLIPTRWWNYLLLLLFGVGCILGLEYLYWIEPGLLEKISQPELSSLDFAVRGNLAAWFTSVLWTFAGLVCIVVFQIDRKSASTEIASFHRLSDIWLWAAVGSLLLSVDSVCQIREFLRIVLVKLSGTSLYGNGEVWWVAVYVVLFGMIGSRLLVEMRHNLLACNTFFVAALSGLLACCLALDLLDLPVKDSRFPIALQTGLEMIGALFALFSFSLFTRMLLVRTVSGTIATTSLPEVAPPKKRSRASKKSTEKPEKTPTVVVEPPPKEEKKTKSKGSASRVLQIVHPAEHGEKIVKIGEIEPLDEEETLEKLKKIRPKKPVKIEEPPEEIEEDFPEEFEEDVQCDEEQWEEEEGTEEEEFEEEEDEE